VSLSVHLWESSPLLTLISTVAGVLTVLAGIWAALYASRPRRGLAYSAKMRRPTGDERAEWVNNIVPNEEQQRAAIITFVLRGTGRRDVPTSAFDNSTPITLSVTGA